MKARLGWLAWGVVFAITLAMMVGQRLSAEVMAVMVGVVAGVLASVPISLIVVWLALRGAGRTVVEVPAPQPAAPREPRIIVMARRPMPQPAYPSPGFYNRLESPAPQAAPLRRFTVIGTGEDYSSRYDHGSSEPSPERDDIEEFTWQR